MFQDGWSTLLFERSGTCGGLAGRRACLRGAAGLIALMASGCGFRPLYGNGGIATGEPSVAAELAATRVTIIPERFGQLLRRGLQQRLGTGVPGPQAARWELRVGPNLQAEGIGIQRDGTTTRVRFVATANWWLVRLSPAPEVVANGVERTIDAFNIPTNQFFAADSSREAAERRLAEVLAEEIVTRVAIRFRMAGTDAPAARPVAPVETPAPLPSVSPLGVGTPGVIDPASGAIGGGFSGGMGSSGALR